MNVSILETTNRLESQPRKAAKLQRDESDQKRQGMMLNDPLPLAILDQSNEKKIITRVAHDWNEVDVRCISEILQSFELLAIDHINENSSEDVSTPSNKRKEDECDQMDMTSTSKKLCTNIIKVEKTKTD
ncbi:hypothetical protein Bca4012_050411 [Brassica carinata]